MSRIPQSFLDDLLNRVDIVDIVDARVKLKRSGKNYSACCPFHDEKTPSFTVSPDKQFYYCFGCGASGTAISFLMEYDRANFVDAVESLAKTVGVEVPREQGGADDEYHRERELKRKRSFVMLENAADFYVEQLKRHPLRHHAVKYLQNRGLSGAIAKAYNIGYAPPGWDNLIQQLGQSSNSLALLADTGLTVEKPEENKRYDRFRHRIMFPIRDGRGRVIGFGGRVLGDDKPKYLNSPETDIFHKGRELYGLYEAKQNTKNLETLIVVEGYMDVIALAQYGLWNAVATLGTACGVDHLTLAFKHVKEVVFCFDGDRAGRSAARRGLMSALESMEDGRQIRFLFLPEGQDPDSLIRQIGADRFQAQLKKAMPLEDFLFEVAADGIDLNSMDGRARFSKHAAPLIYQLPEGVFRSLMLDNLAKRTGLSSEVLAQFTEVPEELIASPEPDGDQDNDVLLKQAEQDLQPTDGENPRPVFARNPFPRPNSRIELSPAKKALVLLLENPNLVNECEELPELIIDDSVDEDVNNLHTLIQYLAQRPNANFSNILGFWGGAKGIQAQHELASLAATQIFSDLKSIVSYAPHKDFQACIHSIRKKVVKKRSQDELVELNNKGLANLNASERKRFLELVQIN